MGGRTRGETLAEGDSGGVDVGDAILPPVVTTGAREKILLPLLLLLLLLLLLSLTMSRVLYLFLPTVPMDWRLDNVHSLNDSTRLDSFFAETFHKGTTTALKQEVRSGEILTDGVLKLKGQRAACAGPKDGRFVKTKRWRAIYEPVFRRMKRPLTV